MLRAALFILMAVGVIGLGAVAWLSINPPPPPPPPVVPIKKINILAAANTLTAGSLMKPDDVESKEVPEAEKPTGARLDTPQARAELFGAMVRQTLLAHQVILSGDVMRPGDHGFLAAVLSPGKRAISVGVDIVSGTAGLIWPGDHVDLILTQELGAGGDANPSKRVAGETVLTDVRVIAIDQQLVQGTSTGSPNAASAQSRTVTLEVSPDDAERVAVASRLGHLSLSVRPVDALPAPEGRSKKVTFGGDVSKALGGDTTAQGAGNSLKVSSPSQDKEYHF